MTYEEKMEYYASIMKELEHFDTPTVTNAVATYPALSDCLGLYEPHKTNWYTDERVKCLYPDLKPRCGFAVTCVYGMPSVDFNRRSFGDILAAIGESPKPVILAMKSNLPEEYRRKNALIGGNMLTAFKQVGVIGVVADGPARDLEEMRPLEVQCEFTGLTAGHGFMPVEAVNVPVTICSMDVAPGEVIHMDQNGSVKFPAKYLPSVLEFCKQIEAKDLKRQAKMKESTDPEEIAKIMKGIYE
ncbi:MAG: RraA family protein [Lachnospiraceae bacterium]|nr:RraA family protein [Lachnospiraceae bacterium]